jgi:hypothetical protein
VWKYLLIATAFEILLAYVSFAIVRAGVDHDPRESDERMVGVEA